MAFFVPLYLQISSFGQRKYFMYYHSWESTVWFWSSCWQSATCGSYAYWRKAAKIPTESKPTISTLPCFIGFSLSIIVSVLRLSAFVASRCTENPQRSQAFATELIDDLPLRPRSPRMCHPVMQAIGDICGHRQNTPANTYEMFYSTSGCLQA